MNRGWWRENAVALVALAVLAPATFGYIAYNENAVSSSGSATHAIEVAEGDTLSPYARAWLGPASASFTTHPDAPADTVVVEVTVAVDPGRPAISCSSPVLRETTGATRQWVEASTDLGGYDSDRNVFCSSEQSESYTLDLLYLVPDDATGPFAVEIFSVAEAPDYVSMIVAP
ncbi:hypothetical protein ACWPKO_29535 (plasmid) [Coraliomargarita sp. W4R53]